MIIIKLKSADWMLSILLISGWVNALVAGPLEGAKGFMFFLCNMELTTEGQGRLNKVKE